MGDIYQWRRRLPPLRIPGAPVEHDDRESTGGSPVTPKKKLKPKISSYFSHHQSALHHVKSEPNIIAFGSSSSAQSSLIAEHAFPRPHQPDAEQLMDSLARRLMTDHVRCLQPSDGSSILVIIEAYRHLLDKNVKLQETAHDEKIHKRHAEVELLRAQQSWSDEREEYKAEVKRLELLISKGKMGVAGVLQSRQNSVLRKRTNRSRTTVEDNVDDDKETVFEFLERTRIDDENAKTKTQRDGISTSSEVSAPTIAITPTPKTRATSPSSKMRVLSEEMSLTSATHDTQFGTPLFSFLAQRLVEQPLIESKPESFVILDSTESPKRRRKASFAASSNYSTFSSTGDALPDEEGENTIRGLAFPPDTQEIRRLAGLIAHQRGLNPEILVAKIHAFCEESPFGNSGASESPIDAPPREFIPIDRTILPEASRVRSNVQVGKTVGQVARRHRRFSFDYGDDSGFGSLQSELTTSKSERARVLRRSHSAMDYVPTMTQGPPSDRGESCEAHPLVLPGNTSLMASTFPLGTSSSVLPRSQRESSSSSAVTAIPQRVSRCTSRTDRRSPVLGAERDEADNSVQSADSRAVSQASSINLATAAAITAVSLKARMEER